MASTYVSQDQRPGAKHTRAAPRAGAPPDRKRRPLAATSAARAKDQSAAGPTTSGHVGQARPRRRRRAWCRSPPARAPVAAAAQHRAQPARAAFLVRRRGRRIWPARRRRRRRDRARRHGRSCRKILAAIRWRRPLRTSSLSAGFRRRSGATRAARCRRGRPARRRSDRPPTGDGARTPVRARPTAPSSRARFRRPAGGARARNRRPSRRPSAAWDDAACVVCARVPVQYHPGTKFPAERRTGI